MLSKPAGGRPRKRDIEREETASLALFAMPSCLHDLLDLCLLDRNLGGDKTTQHGKHITMHRARVIAQFYHS